MLCVYLGYRLQLRLRLRSRNLLERSLSEAKRRTKVIGRFPGESSCLRLCWAVPGLVIRAGRGLDLTHIERQQFPQERTGRRARSDVEVAASDARAARRNVGAHAAVSGGEVHSNLKSVTFLSPPARYYAMEFMQAEGSLPGMVVAARGGDRSPSSAGEVDPQGASMAQALCWRQTRGEFWPKQRGLWNTSKI